MTDTHDLLRRLVAQRSALAANLQADLASLDATIAALAESINATERRLHLLDAPALMTVSAVARYVRVGKHTVYNWLETGELPGKAERGRTYVSCRHDLGGALVLSEFAGAWHELHEALICNPHDVEGVKQTIIRAINAPRTSDGAG